MLESDPDHRAFHQSIQLYWPKWDLSHGKFGLLFPRESQLRQSRATQLTVHAGCFSVSIFHRTLTWTTASSTCAQMLMHAIAHGGVRTHVRESALKVDWEKISLPHRGIEPASAAWRSDALTDWATSPPYGGQIKSVWGKHSAANPLLIALESQTECISLLP